MAERCQLSVNTENDTSHPPGSSTILHGVDGGHPLGVAVSFAAYGLDDLLNEVALAQVLGVCERTVRRMERKGHIPSGIRLGVRKVWRVGDIVEHLKRRAADAQVQAERNADRLNRSYGVRPGERRAS